LARENKSFGLSFSVFVFEKTKCVTEIESTLGTTKKRVKGCDKNYFLIISLLLSLPFGVV